MNPKLLGSLDTITTCIVSNCGYEFPIMVCVQNMPSPWKSVQNMCWTDLKPQLSWRLCSPALHVPVEPIPAWIRVSKSPLLGEVSILQPWPPSSGQGPPLPLRRFSGFCSGKNESARELCSVKTPCVLPLMSNHGAVCVSFTRPCSFTPLYTKAGMGHVCCHKAGPSHQA